MPARLSTMNQAHVSLLLSAARTTAITIIQFAYTSAALSTRYNYKEMESIVIYLNSSVAYAATTITAIRFRKLKELAKKETVEIVFFKDYCRVVGKKSRKVKVPKKITESSEELLKWIEYKIITAWE